MSAFFRYDKTNSIGLYHSKRKNAQDITFDFPSSDQSPYDKHDAISGHNDLFSCSSKNAASIEKLATRIICIDIFC